MEPTTISNVDIVNEKVKIIEAMAEPALKDGNQEEVVGAQKEAKKKSRRGKRRTKAQNNALKREAEASFKDTANVKLTTIPENPSTPTEVIETGASPLTEAAVPKFDEFPLFGKLPTELRLKILNFAINEGRYISMTPGYSYPVADEYDRRLPRNGVDWHDGHPATYLPFSKNHYSILQANRELREEGLKSIQLIENYDSKLAHPSNVYINYKSDLMIVYIGGAWHGRHFPLFDRFTTVLSAQEKAQLQRLVVPQPEIETRVLYMADIRESLPNLRELCFFNAGPLGPDLKVHRCKYPPSVTGNPTVLVDITDYYPSDLIEIFGGEFRRLRKEFAQEKARYPNWKLEKLRLVIWAKKNRGKGMNVGRVADIHGDGIYMQTGERTLEHDKASRMQCKKLVTEWGVAPSVKNQIAALLEVA